MVLPAVGFVEVGVVNRVERVADLTRRRYSATFIAELLGVSERTVVRDRRRAGVACPHKPPLSESQLEWAHMLLEEGCPYKEVARTVGCGVTTLRTRFPGYAFAVDTGWRYSA